MTVGQNIRERRKRAGLTQKKLGELSGTSETTVKQYELEKRQPRLEQLRKIAVTLNTTVNDLIEGDWSVFSQDDFKQEIEDRTAAKLKEEIKSGKARIVSSDEKDLVLDYLKLNPLGKQEARKRVAELTEIPRYQKSANTPISLANAAHERTDVKSTAEDRAADEDMLDE